MTLRARLVLLVVGLLALVLGGLGAFVVRGLDAWTLQVVDGELERRAQVLAASVHLEHGELEREGDGDGPLEASRGWPWRVETAGGEVLLSEGPAWTGGAAHGPTTVEVPTLGRLRVVTLEFTPRAEDDEVSAPLRLRVAAPLAAYEGLSERVRVGVFFALLAAVVLGGLGALLVARLLLRPLERLTSEARHLDAASAAASLTTAGLGPDLATLAEAFNGVLARLSRTLERQRAFTARASHALRTPLAALLSQAEVTLRREREVAEYRAALEGIAASARDSAKLVEGLLAVTRADEATAMDREPVEVAPLLAEVKRLFEARAAQKQLTFEVVAPEGLTVLASRQRLRELLDALLDNAVLYTPERGVVRVEARADAGGVAFDVRDSGPGVPPAEREHLFERFWRGAAGQAAAPGGSGLGLSVVEAIARAEGAWVEVADAPEGGARFTVRFGRA